MSPLDKFEALRLKAILAAVVALLMCGVFALFHHWGVQAQQKRDAPVIAKLKADLGACHADVAFRDERIEGQNRDIQSMADQAAARDAAHASELKAAHAQAGVFLRRANRIAAAKAGPDQCASARDLIVTTFSEERAQ